MIDEDKLEKRQKNVIEIIKNFIKPDLLLKSWNIDGLMVNKYQI
jgi:hypothetical protein